MNRQVGLLLSRPPRVSETSRDCLADYISFLLVRHSAVHLVTIFPLRHVCLARGDLYCVCLCAVFSPIFFFYFFHGIDVHW